MLFQRETAKENVSLHHILKELEYLLSVLKITKILRDLRTQLWERTSGLCRKTQTEKIVIKQGFCKYYLTYFSKGALF